MQESRVQSLFWEDPVCHGATKSVRQLLSPCSTACALQQESPAQREARTLQQRADPHSPQLEKASSVTKMQHGQKIIKKYNVFRKDQQRQRRGTESALFKRGSSPTFYIGQKGIHLWDKAGGGLGGLRGNRPDRELRKRKTQRLLQTQTCFVLLRPQPHTFSSCIEKPCETSTLNPLGKLPLCTSV